MSAYAFSDCLRGDADVRMQMGTCWLAQSVNMDLFLRVQGQADRVNFLMTRQAKVVAMTCTHAALKRREFLQLAFQYDSLVMEESAQILEIETFIPMLLQVCRSSFILMSHAETIPVRSPNGWKTKVWSI